MGKARPRRPAADPSVPRRTICGGRLSDSVTYAQTRSIGPGRSYPLCLSLLCCGIFPDFLARDRVEGIETATPEASKCLAKHRPLRAVRSRSARCPSMVRLVGSDRAWNTASIASLNQSLKRSSRRGNDPPTVDRADRPQERKRELKPRRNKAQRQDRECSGRRRRRRRPARCTACHR